MSGSSRMRWSVLRPRALIAGLGALALPGESSRLLEHPGRADPPRGPFVSTLLRTMLVPPGPAGVMQPTRSSARSAGTKPPPSSTPTRWSARIHRLAGRIPTARDQAHCRGSSRSRAHGRRSRATSSRSSLLETDGPSSSHGRWSPPPLSVEGRPRDVGRARRNECGEGQAQMLASPRLDILVNNAAHQRRESGT